MTESAGSSVERLVDLLEDRLKQSEWDILTALAAADGPLTVAKLAEETGYTERTVSKRVDTLAEQVHGGTLLEPTDDGARLHPQFAAAVRRHADSA
jgi:DNA-binding IclR family transcriptional regulator